MTSQLKITNQEVSTGAMTSLPIMTPFPVMTSLPVTSQRGHVSLTFLIGDTYRLTLTRPSLSYVSPFNVHQVFQHGFGKVHPLDDPVSAAILDEVDHAVRVGRPLLVYVRHEVFSPHIAHDDLRMVVKKVDLQKKLHIIHLVYFQIVFLRIGFMLRFSV